MTKDAALSVRLPAELKVAIARFADADHRTTASLVQKIFGRLAGGAERGASPAPREVGPTEEEWQ